MTLVHRVLFVAWRSPRTGGIYPVARLVRNEKPPKWELVYIRGARAAATYGFAPFLEFPELDRVYESEDLFPLFQNRIPSRSRPDYREFLARLELPASAEEPIAILARSGGRRETDKIEVFGLPSFDPERAHFVYRFFLRGVRHVPGAEERIAGLAPGEQLSWLREVDNPVDRLAILVERKLAGPIGWVPGTLVGDLDRLLSGGSRLEVFAERMNPARAPIHERLLCRLEASEVPGFVPLDSDEYRPIPDGAAPIKIVPQELVAW